MADFSRILAGPLAGQLLADAGARVIKIEQSGIGDETRRWGPPFVADESAYFLSLNRNKESLSLNLKTAEGKAIARRLIERSDVVIHNFLPPQEKRLGLSAASVKRINRRTVHCSIRGYDRDSAEAEQPGYDLLAQAAAGLMVITGEKDGDPMKVGVALSDVLTAHYAHGAILAALFARERSGRGSAVEVSIFGSTVASLLNVAQSFLVTGKEPTRYGNEHPSIVPYQAFHARDRLIVLGVANDRHYQALCRDVLRAPELAEDSRFSSNAMRVQNRRTFIPLLEKILEGENSDTWVARCVKAGIPAAKVQTFREIFAGSGAPLLERVEHPTIGPLSIVGTPVRIEGRRATADEPPPLLGQHTDKILRELGYDRAEIRALHKNNAL